MRAFFSLFLGTLFLAGTATTASALEFQEIALGSYPLNLYVPEGERTWGTLLITDYQRGSVFFGRNLIPMNEQAADQFNALDASKHYLCRAKAQVTPAGQTAALLVYEIRECKPCQVSFETKTCDIIRK